MAFPRKTEEKAITYLWLHHFPRSGARHHYQRDSLVAC